MVDTVRVDSSKVWGSFCEVSSFPLGFVEWRRLRGLLIDRFRCSSVPRGYVAYVYRYRFQVLCKRAGWYAFPIEYRRVFLKKLRFYAIVSRIR